MLSEALILGYHDAAFPTGNENEKALHESWETEGHGRLKPAGWFRTEMSKRSSSPLRLGLRLG